MTVTRHRLALAALVALFAVTRPARAEWPDTLGTFRKTLKVDGDGASPVTATTTVFLDDRFTGFTLTDSQGVSRPCGLLSRDGGRLTLYVNATPGETLYLYPSDRAPLPPQVLDHRSGLRHLTRAYNGCEVASSAQFGELWRSAAVQGGGFVARVYDACNPFGPNTNTLHRYDGFLTVDKAGPTTFCTASTDASFLFVDGREVVAWPGKHPVKPGLDGSKRGTVNLQSGVHPFTYLHANGGPESFAIAAIIPPGEKGHAVIGPERFTPAAYAFVAPLAHREGQPQAAFLWENRYMVNIRDHALYDLTFETALPKDVPAPACEWDFGDGTRGSGSKTEHLFFATGDRTVALTLTFADGRKAACRQTVRIAPRYGQSENDDARTLALLDRAARQERDTGIEPSGYALVSQGYFFFLKEAQAAAFAERALAAADRIPAEDIATLFNELALGVQQVDEQYELAERCFLAIIEKSPDTRAKNSAALHYGGMLNLCLNRPQEARDRLRTVSRPDLIDWEQRLLDIYLADTALVLDDCATARKLYLAIPKPSAVVSGSKLDKAALFDYNSRHFRLQNLLSQQLYREALTELDMLEWEIPEERASPRTNLLKVRALIGNNQPRKAVVCLQRALLAEVDETCTPALRLELAKLYVGMNQLAQAKHQIALIRKESPWTQEEIDARKLSEEIERKLGEVMP